MNSLIVQLIFSLQIVQAGIITEGGGTFRSAEWVSIANNLVREMKVTRPSALSEIDLDSIVERLPDISILDVEMIDSRQNPLGREWILENLSDRKRIVFQRAYWDGLSSFKAKRVEVFRGLLDISGQISKADRASSYIWRQSEVDKITQSEIVSLIDENGVPRLCDKPKNEFAADLRGIWRDRQGKVVFSVGKFGMDAIALSLIGMEIESRACQKWKKKSDSEWEFKFEPKGKKKGFDDETYKTYYPFPEYSRSTHSLSLRKNADGSFELERVIAVDVRDIYFLEDRKEVGVAKFPVTLNQRGFEEVASMDSSFRDAARSALAWIRKEVPFEMNSVSKAIDLSKLEILANEVRIEGRDPGSPDLIWKGFFRDAVTVLRDGEAKVFFNQIAWATHSFSAKIALAFHELLRVAGLGHMDESYQLSQYFWFGFDRDEKIQSRFVTIPACSWVSDSYVRDLPRQFRGRFFLPSGAKFLEVRTTESGAVQIGLDSEFFQGQRNCFSVQWYGFERAIDPSSVESGLHPDLLKWMQSRVVNLQKEHREKNAASFVISFHDESGSSQLKSGIRVSGLLNSDKELVLDKWVWLTKRKTPGLGPGPARMLPLWIRFPNPMPNPGRFPFPRLTSEDSKSLREPGLELGIREYQMKGIGVQALQ